mgnify:CR=1 FL=1
MGILKKIFISNCLNFIDAFALAFSLSASIATNFHVATGFATGLSITAIIVKILKHNKWG